MERIQPDAIRRFHRRCARIPSRRGHGDLHRGHGKRPPDPALAKGAYLQPTVLEAADNGLRVAQEEIFGPVACVLRFRDEEDLVRQANDNVFGLACAIWTRDYKRVFRIGVGSAAKEEPIVSVSSRMPSRGPLNGRIPCATRQSQFASVHGFSIALEASFPLALRCWRACRRYDVGR